LATTMVQPLCSSTISVEWLQIMADVTDLEVAQQLHAQGIYVLPGRNFFWSGSSNHVNCIRIALMRDEITFHSATTRLREALNQFGNRHYEPNVR
jgi:alanine-alpha-ketoisovalerate/valine-pyruvate aminotransferase